MNTVEADDAVRRRAFVVLGIVLVLGIVAWLMLGRATDAGIERLATLDRLRTHCDSLWAAARSRDDSVAVARVALPDTVDPRSDDAIRQCGDLREEEPAVLEVKRPSNPREMTGAPPPGGGGNR